MIRLNIPLFTVIVVFCCFFYGQSGFGSAGSKTEQYIRDIGNGVEYSFDDRMWLIYAGGIGGLARFDGYVREGCKGRFMPDFVSRGADLYGQGLNWLMGNSYILAEYLATERPGKQTREYFQVYNQAFFVNMAFTLALKATLKRERPGKQNFRSFPSGHTSGSFAVAAVLYRIYGREVGVPAFSMAAITGLQRIHDDKHWMSDVLAGALLGTLIGNGFAELLDKNKNETTDKKFMVGISLTF